MKSMSQQTSCPLKELSPFITACARGAKPRLTISPADWGKQNFIVPMGPQKGQHLDLSLTPYVLEPLEMLRVDSPHVRVVIKKSAQTGFSTLGLVWVFCLIATCPDDMMIVQPTLAAAKDFNSERLDGAIKACKALGRLIRPQRSRDTDGSKTLEKKFPG